MFKLWCERGTSLRIILTKQNKCVRSMLFAYSRDNATPYFNLLGILQFENGSTNIQTIFHTLPLLGPLRYVPIIPDLLPN